VRTEGLELRALVPVSIRSEDEQGALGNRIAAMRGPLPVYVDDPVERLRIVSEAMTGLKESKQALGAEVIAGLSGFAPPTILAQASRLNFSTRLFNLIVTNVPGPQFPLYMHGRELQELVPLAFLPEEHAVAIAIMSYNGGLAFGLLADYDAMPDLDFLGESLERSLAELLSAAGQPAPGRGSVAERELRVLAHQVRRPGRREGHRRVDALDAVELAHELPDLLGHLRADRAARRGQRERHVHVPAVHLHLVDQPQLNEIEPQFGVDHVAERVVHLVN